jgi:hypothetical protein
MSVLIVRIQIYVACVNLRAYYTVEHKALHANVKHVQRTSLAPNVECGSVMFEGSGGGTTQG